MQLIRINRSIKSKTDRELLAGFKKDGNSDQLGELYSRYLHLVYGVCLKYFSETEKSKDAVIEIYEKIQNEIVNHEVKNFKSWLYIVTKNYCLMELRKTKSEKIVLFENENALSGFMESEPVLHPLDNEQLNNEKKLNDCIKKLKNEQKNCIRYFYFENKCYREISELLKTTEKKVKSYLQNGKRNVKICMEKKK